MAAYDSVPMPGAPSPGTYAPSPIDFSAISQVPGAFQQGQQYAVKRGLQTMYADGNMPTKPDGSPDYGAIASKALKIGGPEAAAPYFNMAIQQGNAGENQQLLSGGQGGGQPQQTPQQQQGAPQSTFTPVTASTGSGSILPFKPGESPPQIMGDSTPAGAGREGQPAPFAGNRSDGTSSAPAAAQPASSAPQDRRMVAADRLDAEAARLAAQAAKYGQNPAAVKSLQDRAGQLADQAKQYREAALKDQALTDPQKTALGTGHGTDVGASEGALEYQKKDADRFVKMGGEISTGNTEAAKERPQLELIKNIMADPGFNSGAASGLIQKYKQWTVALGGDPNAGLPMEAFGKAVQNLALSQIRSMAGTGPVRVAEMRIIQQAIANKDYTPATNRLLIEIADRNYARNQTIATMARQYASPNGPGKGRLDGGFEDKVAQYDQEHPVFKPAELNDPRIIAPQRFHTPAEADAAGLPPGTPYTDMTGKHLKMTQ